MHGPSTRGKLLIAALALTIVGSLICLFFPLLFAQTFYYSRDTILMLIPARNFGLLALAIACIIGTLVLLAFRRTVFSYTVAAMLIICAIFTAVASAMSITLIEQQGVTIRDVLRIEQYAWEDVAEVTYYYTAHVDEGKYVFQLRNGEEVTIAETPLFDTHKKALLRELLKKHHISYDSHAN